jgi:predicted nucleic acid-binding Zn ribbon protein
MSLPCPQCGETAARKVSGGAGLLFKGAGFYITDYGKDGKKDQRTAGAGTTGSSATPDGSKTASSSESSSDSRSESASSAGEAPAKKKDDPAPAVKKGSAGTE